MVNLARKTIIHFVIKPSDIYLVQLAPQIVHVG